MKKITITERDLKESDLNKKEESTIRPILAKILTDIKQLSTFENITSIILLATVAYAVCIFFMNSLHFDLLVEEDGFYENLTALFLFLTCFSLIFKFSKYHIYYNTRWKFGILLMIAGLFFGGGEEISWGQRIFHIESSTFFKVNNAQQETNLHNMVIGRVKLNKLIFSNLLSIGFGFYFLVLPILWIKIPKVKRFVDGFGILVARPVHILIFLVATLLVLILINSPRKWEVWEFAFAMIMFLIVYNPLNTKEIFSKKLGSLS